MSDALTQLLDGASTPTPGASEAARARPNPRLLDSASGDVANARSFRDAAAMDAAASAQHVQVDPELVHVADVLDMLRIIDEEMAKMLPPEAIRATWAPRVDSGEFRTLMQPRHKAARFMVGHIVGNLPVGIFRQHVQNAVVGEKGGSLYSVVRNQQFMGRWEPYDYSYRNDIMGGGTIVDVDKEKILGQTSGTRQIFLTVQFIDISGKPPVVYDAKGNPNTDFSKGGEAMAEMVKLMKEISEKSQKSEDRAEARAVSAENALLREQMAKLQAMVEALAAPKPDVAPASPRRRPPSEDLKAWYARNRGKSEEDAAKAGDPKPE